VDLSGRISEIASDAGLAGLGVCSAEPFVDVHAQLEARVASGFAGSLKFTFADPRAATDVRSSFPWAQCLVVGAWAYLPAAGDPGPSRPGTGRVARFATENHYRGLRSGLGLIATALREAGYEAEVLVDDSRLVDRAAAVRAGVGWWGKNTMVLAPRFGPWLLLGSVVTDAPLPTTNPMQRDCGTCSACIPACPTGALVAPGVLDATRCLAYWAQAPGAIPVEFRAAMGDRLYGCDDCLDACPPGHRLLEEASTNGGGRAAISHVLGADDATLLARFDHFYVPRRQARYLRRNALVVLGNSERSDAIGVAAGFLGHPDWLLRMHAAWALGRISDSRAHAALSHQLGFEREAAVRAEIHSALTSTG
jgi:epoxyqueuosine reductase